MKDFTKNETVSLMHECNADAFRRVADFIEKFNIERQEAIELLRELADQQDAQSIVVGMRGSNLLKNLP